jgi:hypothetical protein
LVLLFTGCSDDTIAPQPDARRASPDRSGDRSLGSPELRVDAPAPADAARPDANPCSRPLAPADRVRRVVVSHPFQGSGNKTNLFEVLELSQGGKLAKTGATFSLGVAVDGEIHFTPDGALGLVAQDDGSIGVFRLDAGAPQVVHAAFKGKGYISRLVLSEDGQRVYGLSSQWRNVGGGIYSLRINCDGTLTDEGLLAASKLPYALARLAAPSAKALVVAKDLLASKAGDDVHLVDLASTPPTLIAGARAFGDDEAIVSNAALTSDGRYLLIADTNMFGGNRVAAVELTSAGGLRAAQVLKGLSDPAAVVASPISDVALVLNGEANTISILDYTPSDATTPFKLRGPAATSSKPQLPLVAVRITRGSLAGRVIIAENVALRQLQLTAGGGVSEVEHFSLGSGLTAIPGALGVQP